MKIYHVETQQAYDELMIELEEKGCKWRWGEKPTKLDKFKTYGKDTYIYEEYGGIISFSDGYYFKVYRSSETLIEYKAKGEDMTQEEMKRYFLNESRDVSIAIENFVIDDLTTENPLSKAKSSAKKLIEKIDEYLESQKPEFKVGDIVASRVFSDGSFSLVRLNKDLTNRFTQVYGLWYTKRDCDVVEASLGVFKEDTRHATPEEIAEYESALNFHKHGRKPFEVKKGDLIRTPIEEFTLIWYPENFSKKEFLACGWEILKTAEEVIEWLGADDE